MPDRVRLLGVLLILALALGWTLLILTVTP